MQYVFLAVIGVVCAVIGFAFALFPRRTFDMDPLQQKVSRALGIVFCLLFFVFMVAGRDAESWAVIGGGLIGFALGSVPPIRRSCRERFVLFTPPAKPAKDSKSAKAAAPKKTAKRK
ncbi:hypothetical protein KIH77_00690 [Bifidobacterium sp. 82T24]|uniref:hypothetical protein n=1 Tax=Bifidobacterium pluvialisilvae TaxID=2834436 RepID=UPI001C584F97|nr:hypothetical protein [Bifidobacterium pluvialisilvae]MBW3087262.1 hypothetical protein [Bifidobacterium pluvialisilvae]